MAIATLTLNRASLLQANSHRRPSFKQGRTAVLSTNTAAVHMCLLARPSQGERIHLLSEHTERLGMPSWEQEMLHYQWFADMGYTDAQRIVGRLLSQAGDQSAEKGLRYVR